MSINQPLQIRPFSQNEHGFSFLSPLTKPRPKLFGDKRHEGVQQAQRPVQSPGGRRAGLGLRRLILALQGRLDKLQIPIAEDIPDKTVERARRLIETVGLDACGYGEGSLFNFAYNPLVNTLV